MTEQRYFVVARMWKRLPGGVRRKYTIVDRQGPLPYDRAAERQKAWQLLRTECKVSVEADRAEYFAAYHRKRYETDEKYRVTRRKTARERSKRVRAAARGDMTPWLTQD